MAAMTTAYAYVPASGHQYPDHLEAPSRFDVLAPALDAFGAKRLEAQPATREEIGRVHGAALIHTLEAACKAGPSIIDPAPTYITETSFEDALLAAGASLA